MKGLTALDLVKVLVSLDKTIDLSKVEIVIGDDEELNGIHSAFFINDYDMAQKNDDTDWVKELIKDSCGHCTMNADDTTKHILMIS